GLYPRHPVRHPPAEGAALPGARHADLSQGPGAMGEKSRRQGVRGRRDLHPHGPLGPSEAHGTVECRQEVGGTVRVGVAVDPEARPRDDRLRRGDRLDPVGVEGAGQPIHEVALAAFGMHIFDNCDLEELSQTAAKYKRWEFLLTAAPLRVVGGTGSPLNPIATY